MKRRACALAALAVPMAVIALMMAPILMAFGGSANRISAEVFVQVVLPVLISFGVPQYIVFALVLAIVLVTRPMSAAAIRRLALWAPVLFLPVLVAPVVGSAILGAIHHRMTQWGSLFQVVAMLAGVGLCVGYVCAILALGFWEFCEGGATRSHGPVTPQANHPPTS